MVDKCIVCDACLLRSWDPSSFESISLLYITPTFTTSTQELIMQGMQQKWKIPAFDIRRPLRMSNLIKFYRLQNI